MPTLKTTTLAALALLCVAAGPPPEAGAADTCRQAIPDPHARRRPPQRPTSPDPQPTHTGRRSANRHAGPS